MTSLVQQLVSIEMPWFRFRFQTFNSLYTLYPTPSDKASELHKSLDPPGCYCKCTPLHPRRNATGTDDDRASTRFSISTLSKTTQAFGIQRRDDVGHTLQFCSWFYYDVDLRVDGIEYQLTNASGPNNNNSDPGTRVTNSSRTLAPPAAHRPPNCRPISLTNEVNQSTNSSVSPSSVSANIL